MANIQNQGNNKVHFRLTDWMHSSASICSLLIFASFIIILGIYLCVCTPKKYDLRAGSISHVTIDAPKDVEDTVATREKRNEAAEKVQPSYQFQQDVKGEVLASLEDVFQELSKIQQYGMTLRPEEDGKRIPARPFSESEIDWAYSLVDTLVLTRNQITTLLRVDADTFKEMVDNVTIAVENSLNAKISEGMEQNAIDTINKIVGYRVDVSLMQNIVPVVLETCIKPNDVIDQVGREYYP